MADERNKTERYSRNGPKIVRQLHESLNGPSPMATEFRSKSGQPPVSMAKPPAPPAPPQAKKPQ